MKRLRANPAAKPKYEGGNATYGFFTLETSKPNPANMTISVVADKSKSAQADYLVLDATANPTAAQQRKVIEALRRQRNSKPKTSPSRKADS